MEKGKAGPDVLTEEGSSSSLKVVTEPRVPSEPPSCSGRLCLCSVSPMSPCVELLQFTDPWLAHSGPQKWR